MKSILAVPVTIILIVSGCTRNDSDIGAGNQPRAALKTKPKVEISLWTGPNIKLIRDKEDLTPDYGDYERLLAKEFMDAHPEVSIEVEVLNWEDLPKKVPASVMGGDPPNLLIDYLGRTSGYAYGDALEPLEKLASAEELADYNPDYIKMFTINGHLHALPMFSWANHLVGNRKIWEEAGAAHLLPPLDDPNWTFDEFEKALEAVAKPNAVWPIGLQVASEQGDYSMLGYLWGTGAKLYENADYSHVALNSPEGVKGLERLCRWVDKDWIEPGATIIQGSILDSLFWRGRTAIGGASLRRWIQLKAAESEGRVKRPVELFLAHFPHAEGVKNGVAVGPTGVCVFKQPDAEKRRWAVAFACFLNSPEHQREYCASGGWFPTRSKTGDPKPDDPKYAAVQKLIEERGIVDMGLTSPKYYSVRVLLPPQIQAAFLHRKTPAQALADFERAANKVLTEE